MLIVIEPVLGIDSLVFIAILVEKLPLKQHDRARATGLLLAMLMRLLLLASISWLITLTQPLFSFHLPIFSACDPTILFGGFFLLFKTTVELSRRLEGRDNNNPTQRKGVKFREVVTQIVVLDAIFSLGSVIAVIEMVDHLLIMMAAMVIAISLMLVTSRLLAQLVNSHPTIIILCLSFLLMIGFSLVAGGFGFVISEGHLYAVAGFSMMIETLNQLAILNRRRFLSANQTLRQRAIEAVMRLLSRQKEDAELGTETTSMLVGHGSQQIFNPQERRMIERVLNLNQRTVNSIMMSRHDTKYIDLNTPEDEVRQLLGQGQHTRLVVTDGNDAEDLLGIVRTIDLLQQLLRGEPLNLRVLIRQPLVFPGTLPLSPTLEQLHNAYIRFAFVVDEFGSVEGIVTLSDVTETTAGNLPNEVEETGARRDIQKNADGFWTTSGYMPLEDLVQYVSPPLDERREYHTIAGLPMRCLQYIPRPGEEVQVGDYLLKMLQVGGHRVQKMQAILSHKGGGMGYEV